MRKLFGLLLDKCSSPWAISSFSASGRRRSLGRILRARNHNGKVNCTPPVKVIVRFHLGGNIHTDPNPVVQERYVIRVMNSVRDITANSPFDAFVSNVSSVDPNITAWGQSPHVLVISPATWNIWRVIAHHQLVAFRSFAFVLYYFHVRKSPDLLVVNKIKDCKMFLSVFIGTSDVCLVVRPLRLSTFDCLQST